MQLKLTKIRVCLEKVFLRFVIIEKKINVLHGQSKLVKMLHDSKKKQFIMIML